MCVVCERELGLGLGQRRESYGGEEEDAFVCMWDEMRSNFSTVSFQSYSSAERERERVGEDMVWVWEIGIGFGIAMTPKSPWSFFVLFFFNIWNIVVRLLSKQIGLV